MLGAWLRGLIAVAVILLGCIQIWETWLQRTRSESDPPAPAGPFALLAHDLSARAQRLGLVNSYGLFRVMTTERPEIIFEGSDDGQTWKPYEFVWKPGDPMRQPSFTTPHMPRLDWQMWFAALSIYYDHQVPEWLGFFADQLKAGNPDVLALLDNNPFPKAPPKQLRIRLYLYKFTTPEEQMKTGAWWTRTLVGG